LSYDGVIGGLAPLPANRANASQCSVWAPTITRHT